jgi:hypothetical protein
MRSADFGTIWMTGRYAMQDEGGTGVPCFGEDDVRDSDKMEGLE